MSSGTRPAAPASQDLTSRSTLSWLLAGDPAIRWQVRRDLLDATPAAVEREQRRVASEGWGKRLLARQDAAGTWAGRMYSPKWISTTYTLLLLRDLGLRPESPEARKGCSLLLDRGLCPDGGIGFGWGRSETCVSGMVLSILSWFAIDDERLDRIADRLLEEQMSDGGWNCRRPFGATHASMHTTVLALEGLLLYERHRARRARRLEAVRSAQWRGREFLLAHRLFRSHRTGAVIKREFLRLAFPPQWHFDVLRGLDHFRAAGAGRDERLVDAIALLKGKRRPDGRWTLEHRHPARYWFPMEELRRPSRWNTLRALRVLRWWEEPPRPEAGRDLSDSDGIPRNPFIH
jgi:hypothetical protein